MVLMVAVVLALMPSSSRAGHGGGGSSGGGSGHGSAGHGRSTHSGSGQRVPAFAFDPRESNRRYLNHVAGYDHVPGLNAGVPRRLVSPNQAYMDHVAGLDQVYHRR